jgi:hypothetical protein
LQQNLPLAVIGQYHSMTSSARSMTDCGIERPSAFAVVLTVRAAAKLRTLHGVAFIVAEKPHSLFKPLAKRAQMIIRLFCA